MESKTSVRKCEACKNCQPMFPKAVERSSLTPRAVAPMGARHVCEKHGHTHSHEIGAGCHAAGSHAPRSLFKDKGSAVSAVGSSQLSDSETESLPSLTETASAPLDTSVDSGFEDRLDAAITTSIDLIAEAQAQLAELTLPGSGSHGVDGADGEVDAPLQLSDIVRVYEYTPDSIGLRSRTSSTEETIDEPTSPQSDFWFDAEEQSMLDVSSVQMADTPASTADVRSRTTTPASVTQASAQTCTVRRAPSKPAPRQQKGRQGWHTLWSVDYSAKWLVSMWEDANVIPLSDEYCLLAFGTL